MNLSIRQVISLLVASAILCATTEGKEPHSTIPSTSYPSKQKSVTLKMTSQEYLEFMKNHSQDPRFLQIAQLDQSEPVIDTLLSPTPCDSSSFAPKPCLENTLRQDSLAADSTDQEYEAYKQSIRDSIYTFEDEEVEPVGRTEGYFVQFISDLGSTSTDWDEFAVVLYIVVGVAVVAVFLVGGLKIVYDIIVDNKTFPLWRDVSFSYTYSENRINDNFNGSLQKYTHILSGRFSLGLYRKNFGVGVASELGYLDMSFNQNRSHLPLVELDGFYGLFGPVVRLGSTHPLHLDLEFLNGYSSSEAMGWISKARMIGNFDLSKHVFLGLYIGSLFVDLKETQGTLFQGLKINDDLSILFGATLGFQF